MAARAHARWLVGKSLICETSLPTPGRGGVSVNRCHTADRAEFRRRLLSGNMPCDGRSNFLDDVRTGDIGDHAQPTAAVRTDRQINREHSAQPRHQRRESGQELDWLEHKMAGAVLVRGLELIHHLPCRVRAQPFQRQGGSGDVSTQPLDPVTLMWRAGHRRIQREPVSEHAPPTKLGLNCLP